jgi:hypothetical protein
MNRTLINEEYDPTNRDIIKVLPLYIPICFERSRHQGHSSLKKPLDRMHAVHFDCDFTFH